MIVIGLLISIHSLTADSLTAIDDCRTIPWSDSTQVVFIIDSSSIHDEVRIDTLRLKNGQPDGFVEITSIPRLKSKPDGKVVPEEVSQKYAQVQRVETKMWVSMNGTVGQVRIKKCIPEEIREYVFEYARRCVFTPAEVASGPVSVMVMIPFPIHK